MKKEQSCVEFREEIRKAARDCRQESKVVKGKTKTVMARAMERRTRSCMRGWKPRREIFFYQLASHSGIERERMCNRFN